MRQQHSAVHVDVGQSAGLVQELVGVQEGDTGEKGRVQGSAKLGVLWIGGYRLRVQG